jgi:hypothetical protein
LESIFLLFQLLLPLHCPYSEATAKIKIDPSLRWDDEQRSTAEARKTPL